MWVTSFSHCSCVTDVTDTNAKHAEIQGISAFWFTFFWRKTLWIFSLWSPNVQSKSWIQLNRSFLCHCGQFWEISAKSDHNFQSSAALDLGNQWKSQLWSACIYLFCFNIMWFCLWRSLTCLLPFKEPLRSQLHITHYIWYLKLEELQGKGRYVFGMKSSIWILEF